MCLWRVTNSIIFAFYVIRGVAKVGELVNFEACMDIMDLLYEKEETSILFSSPVLLAASILARLPRFFICVIFT